MLSWLRKRAAFNCFSIALILSAVLDALSTIYAWHLARTWDVEDNPVFRGLGRATSGTVSPVVLLFAMKATVVGILILWLRLTLRLVPGLYPQCGRQLGFSQFANFLFCGVEACGWKSIFIVPSMGRLYRGLSVPVAMVVIFGQFSASVVNTLQLLPGFSSVVIFWVAVAGVGALAGLEIIRRDFLALSQSSNSQPTD
jgi:hypothetical protein